MPLVAHALFQRGHPIAIVVCGLPAARSKLVTDSMHAIATVAEILEDKIRNRTARVGIIGLGYVGLPLAVEFAKAGFSVTGIDVQESKVEKLNSGDSYIQDVAPAALRP